MLLIQIIISIKLVTKDVIKFAKEVKKKERDTDQSSEMRREIDNVGARKTKLYKVIRCMLLVLSNWHRYVDLR